MQVLCQIDGVDQVLLHHGETVVSVFGQFHSDFPENAGDIFRTINFAAVGKQVTVVKRKTLSIQAEGFFSYPLQSFRRSIVTHHTHRYGTVCPQKEWQGIHFQNLLSPGIISFSGNSVQHLPASILPDQQPHMGIHRAFVRSHHGLTLQTASHAENQVAFLQHCRIHACRQGQMRRLLISGTGRNKKKQKDKGETKNPPVTSTSGQSSIHRSA